MSDLHRLAAQLALILAALLVGWSLALLALRRRPGGLFAGNAAWTGLAILAAAGVGLVMLLQGDSPADGLHVLYGVLAAGVLPATLPTMEGRPPQQRATVLAVGAVVLLILLLRLFQTG